MRFVRDSTVPRPPWNSERFWSQVARLDEGDLEGIERALVFLEDDPWSCGSGYVKEHLARNLARHRLDPLQQERVAAVLLYVVDIGDRWEFRWYCRLARQVRVDLIRDGLAQRLDSNEPGVARRAVWMLAALRQPRLTEQQLSNARAEVLRLAAGRPSTWWTYSLRNLVVRFWSLEWEAELLVVAQGDSEAAAPALRLLSRLSRLHIPADDTTATRIASAARVK